MRVWKVYVAWCLLCFLAAITFSKLYWKYFLIPPGPLITIEDFQKVDAQYSLLLRRTNRSFPLKLTTNVKPDTHYDAYSGAATAVHQIEDLHAKGKLLPESFAGVWYRGDLVVGFDDSGKRVAYLQVKGQHYDDHNGNLQYIFPFQESGALGSPQVEYFEYDVAGFEAVHWAMMILLMLVGLLGIGAWKIFVLVATADWSWRLGSWVYKKIARIPEKFFTREVAVVAAIAFVWVPAYYGAFFVGSIGEASVCYFRFSLYDCDSHHYGKTSFETIFLPKSSYRGKYGATVLYKKLAGPLEYHKVYEQEYFEWNRGLMPNYIIGGFVAPMFAIADAAD